LKKESDHKTKYSYRAGLRLNSTEREQIELLIQKGAFKSISQALRAALNEFLNKPEVEAKRHG
jgi:Arc/MetJ-type ribon-helix-helix transcriptional regulator